MQLKWQRTEMVYMSWQPTTASSENALTEDCWHWTTNILCDDHNYRS